MTPPGSGFDERVVVIEHEAFRNLWKAELDGGLVVEREDADKIVPGAADDLPRRGEAPLRHRDPPAHPRARPLRQRAQRAAPRRRPRPADRAWRSPTSQPNEYVQYRGLHLIDKGDHRGVRVRRPLRRGSLRRDHLLHPQRRQGGRRRPSLGRVRDARTDGPRLPRAARLRAARRARRQGHPPPAGRERRPGTRRRRVPAGDPGAVDHRARADDRGERAARIRDPAVPVVTRDRRRRAHRLQPDAGRQLARGQVRALARPARAT